MSHNIIMYKRNDFRIRKVCVYDREILLKWRNSERVRSVMFSDHLISSDEHNAWLNNCLNAKIPQILVVEWIDVPIGVVTIDRINLNNSTCYWGFYIGEKECPKGIGLVLGILGLNYIFDNMNMRKIYSECFAFNKKGVDFHKKMGFSQEGCFIKHQIKNGVYEDVLSFALFRDNWIKKRYQIECKCFEQIEK